MDTAPANTLEIGDKFVWYDNTYSVIGIYPDQRKPGWVVITTKERPLKPFKFHGGRVLSIKRADGGNE